MISNLYEQLNKLRHDLINAQNNLSHGFKTEEPMLEKTIQELIEAIEYRLNNLSIENRLNNKL